MLKIIHFLTEAPRLLQDGRIILASGLFDAEWYQLAHPYVVRDKVDPLVHFVKNARKYRLSPSRSFDTARYLDQHADARLSRMNPLVHYIKYGRAQGLAVHRAPPSAADRIIASGLFNEEWYLRQYPDVANAGYPALLHFLVHGSREGRSPGPDFDAAWYLAQYSDLAAADPLLHYIDYGFREGRAPRRTGRVFELARETLRGVEDLEPELYGADYFEHADGIPVINGRARHPVARAFEKIVKRIETPPRAIVFLPWLVHGGSDLVACHAIRSLAEKYGEKSVLVILGDSDRLEALHLLPAGVPLISFERLGEDLSQPERVELLDLLVRNLQPDVILNVNCRVCWEALKRHGGRLARFSRLYAMLFCEDYSASGRRNGYSDQYLRQCLPYLSGIYFDNQTYIDQLIDQFGVPEELQTRLVNLPQPAPDIAEKSPRTRAVGAPLRVLWAGRLMPQKNVQLLLELAEGNPQFEFHIWGRGSHALEMRLAALSERCSHVHFHGPFERFGTLPLVDYDAFLYTSLWDGIPNVLLEAAAAGLPIVASGAGGIRELVTEKTGWLIEDIRNPLPYVQALRDVAANSQQTQNRAEAMMARLRENHSWQNYRDILLHQPYLTGGLLHAAPLDNGNSERASGRNAGETIA
ncbi:glycosyltransferase family 4 protein [Shinella sp. G-2]|uniref:glycosyltransferase family 4 protein n=1 Tax=Shinella sp. G-2 TaxID=3133141 RepID=UPI003D078F70